MSYLRLKGRILKLITLYINKSCNKPEALINFKQGFQILFNQKINKFKPVMDCVYLY